MPDIHFHDYTPLPFEVVERKGLGHPDTLADGISEAISQELCRRYLEETGTIQHHNVDKVLIIGGQTKPVFGGGDILVPPAVVIGGRATSLRGSRLNEVISEATGDYIHRTMRYLREYGVEPRTHHGAPELQSLMGLGANDTSIGVGYAPLSPVETVVLELERKVREVPGVGDDVKVMAVRQGEDLRLVVAAAVVSRFVSSLEEYREVLARVKDTASACAGGTTSNLESVDVNAADHGDNIFLTVTGTSAEMGDDGATGRGNRVNGLIAPMRPMTMEAVAGKNPVSHVGKVYNVMARGAAEEIARLEEVREAYVTLVSKIGAPLDEPLVRSALLAAPRSSSLEYEADAILEQWLGKGQELAEAFAGGRINIY